MSHPKLMANTESTGRRGRGGQTRLDRPQEEYGHGAKASYLEEKEQG